LAYSYRLGLSTVSQIIRETSEAIWNALKDDFLAPPTRQQWQSIAEEFWERWNFPMCCGAIDGKHVAVKVNKFEVFFFVKSATFIETFRSPDNV
jgi:hypothetical protein